jgi:hypothetical protein
MGQFVELTHKLTYRRVFAAIGQGSNTPSAVNGSSPFKRDNLRVAPLGLQKWRGKILAFLFNVVCLDFINYTILCISIK